MSALSKSETVTTPQVSTTGGDLGELGEVNILMIVFIENLNYH